MMKEYPLVQLGTLISQAKTVRCGEADYPVLSMTMHNGLVFQDKKFKKVIASKDRSNYKIVCRNQLVISFPIDEGVLAAQRITDIGIVSPAYGIWDIDQEKVLPEFLEYALRCERALHYYKSKLRGSTARRRSLPTPTLLAFTIPLPSIDEQLHILEIVHKVKDVIDKREKEINYLDELVKARFVEMFGEQQPSSNLSDYIHELRSGKSLAGSEVCKNKVLKTGAATFGWFDPKQYKYLPDDYQPRPEHRVETGDLIISRMNTPNLVGACSFVFKAPEDMYYPDRLWKVIPTQRTNLIFLWQLLWDSEVRKQIKEKSSGTSGTMHNISKARLLEVKCIDVSLELQNQYANFVLQVVKSKFEDLC
jgi:type I restriction enzyme S subunit